MPTLNRWFARTALAALLLGLRLAADGVEPGGAVGHHRLPAWRDRARGAGSASGLALAGLGLAVFVATTGPRVKAFGAGR